MKKTLEAAAFVLILCAGLVLFLPPHSQAQQTATPEAQRPPSKSGLHIEQDEHCRVIQVYRDGGHAPILVENAYEDTRPYIYPLVAPDGKGLLTEFRPWHHPHQMGIFWGLKYINGRDYFMKWQGDYYRRVSAAVVQAQGQQVKWETVYDMLDGTGQTIMTETQDWSLQAPGGQYVVNLKWKGDAKKDLSIAQYYVGGLFVRMPWYPGVRAEAVNSLGQHNQATDAQPAKWVDMGIQVDGREDLAHIAILDNPDNHGFPVVWRVDSQFGFGPDRSWRAWKLAKGNSEVLRYQLLAYTGDFSPSAVNEAWSEFAGGK